MEAAATATTSPGKGRRKREATEAQIIAAFGRVVERRGLRNVGVNEVLKEAGVGKALLYRYFGGLPGLVRAWGQRRRVWPELSALAEFSAEASGGDPGDHLKRIVVRNADVHRADPLRIEMLADELMAATPISGALTEIRQQLGRDHASIFAGSPEVRRHHLLMVVMMAAASYLAMRAVKAPRFMGEDLADEATWARVMGEIESIIGTVAAVRTPAA